MANISIKSLKDFFTGNQNYLIPIFQRSYTWDEDDAIKFLDDIYNWYKLINEKNIPVPEAYNKYFAGSVITYNNKQTGKKSIIDGQQRLTTTILILSALKNIRIENKEDTNEINKLIFYKQYENNSQDNKLKLNNPSTNDILKHICDNQSNLKEEDIPLVQNYKGLIERIKEIKNLDPNYYDNIIESLQYVTCTYVELENDDNPTKVFETINTTGKKLNPVDLIKNFIFSYSYELDSKTENELLNLYDRIEKLIWIKNKEEDLMTFFRYYNVIKFKTELANEESNEIYHLFKDNINKQNLDLRDHNVIKSILEDIYKHAWIWREIYDFSPNKFKNGNNYNQKEYFYSCFKQTIKTYYTLAHQLMFDFIKDQNDIYNLNINEDNISNIFKLIMKLIFSIFLSNIDEKEVTRNIPNIYNNFLRQNSSGLFSDFEEFLRKRENSEIRILNNEEILINLKNINVNNKKAKFLLYGIEQIITRWEHSSSFEEINKFTIEHICPKVVNEDTDYWQNTLQEQNNDILKTKEYLKQRQDKLGNLTLVMKGLNSELSNKPFYQKKKLLWEKTSLQINQKIVKYQEWNDESYNDRVKWLSEQINSLFSI